MLSAFFIGLGAGIAASPHCLGMCGGFPLALARSSAGRTALLRQLLFVTGKAFTYIFLGTLAGALGVVLLKDTAISSLGPYLRIFAGLVTIFFGILMLGVRLPPIRALQNISETGFVRSVFGGVLGDPSPAAAFVLGLGVGFLPCPLPMGMLAAGAASGSVPEAMVLMAGVGAGTAPVLVAVGLFGIGLDRRFARIGMRGAAAVVILIGLMTLMRATGALARPSSAHSSPPCCSQHSR